MIRTISHPYQLIADHHIKITRGAPNQKYPTLKNGEENGLLEDVLDDMGHFIRSLHYLLEQEGPAEKILNTISRLRLLVDVLDVQLKEMDTLWDYYLEGSDETVCCAVLFSLASVQKEGKDSVYLLKALDELITGVTNLNAVIQALKLAQHPELDRQLKKKMKETDPGISAKIHRIIQFRKHNKKYLYI